MSGSCRLRKIGAAQADQGHLEGLERNVRVCAYTHCACRLVGGETVAHLLHLNKSLKDTWFLVDEVGLLPVSTLGAMSRWLWLGAKFIVFGDYEGQFQPFWDRLDMSQRDGRNALTHQMSNGFCCLLQTYQRGTDPELFAWFHAMYGQEDARGLAEQSRQRYPAECDPARDPLVLCVSHKKRMRVNARQNERLKPEAALQVAGGAEPMRHHNAAAEHVPLGGHGSHWLPARVGQTAHGARRHLHGDGHV